MVVRDRCRRGRRHVAAGRRARHRRRRRPVPLPRPGPARRRRAGRATSPAAGRTPPTRRRRDGRRRHAGTARDRAGRCAGRGRAASGWTPPCRCSPASGCSTCCSRSPGAARAAVPGGFGTGKTVLLQQIAKWCDADVIVYVGCGERGNEMADVRRGARRARRTRAPGGRLADRTVVIANTSNMPMMAREASIYTGVTVGGVLPRHGLRTPSSSPTRPRAGPRRCASSPPAPARCRPRRATRPAWPRRWPRSTSGPAASRRWAATIGSVTIIGAVSPPGGDMTEPVTAHTQRFVRCAVDAGPRPGLRPPLPGRVLGRLVLPRRDRLAAWHAGNGDPAWARAARAG